MADIICHQVNCQGVMGSGVAKAIKEKFPSAYQDYLSYYKIHELKPGVCQITKLPDSEMTKPSGSQYIANLAGQEFFGYDGKRYTSYDAVMTGLEYLASFCKRTGLKSVAFPYRFGCDRGGANWNVILTMIQEAFSDLDITIEIHSII